MLCEIFEQCTTNCHLTAHMFKHLASPPPSFLLHNYYKSGKCFACILTRNVRNGQLWTQNKRARDYRLPLLVYEYGTQWNSLWFCFLRLLFINRKFTCYFDIPSLPAYGTQPILCKILHTFMKENFCDCKWKSELSLWCYMVMHVLSYCKSQRLNRITFMGKIFAEYPCENFKVSVHCYRRARSTTSDCNNIQSI